jgi:hypothetical protein
MERGDPINGKEKDTRPQINGEGLMRRRMRKPPSIW